MFYSDNFCIKLTDFNKIGCVITLIHMCHQKRYPSSSYRPTIYLSFARFTTLHLPRQQTGVVLKPNASFNTLLTLFLVSEAC